MKTNRVSLSAAAIAGLALAAAAQFTVSGPGGTFPSGTGSNGYYPHAAQTSVPALPTNSVDFPLATPVPGGASRFTSVTIRNLYHTWSGDAHFVLVSPGGQEYNLVTPPNIFNPVNSAYGSSCDYGSSSAGSDYTFVDPSVSVTLSFPPDATQPCNGGGGAYHDPGTYVQYFGAGNGAWPSSPPNNLGILNVNLHAIPAVPGTWILRGYDWFTGADNGTFTSWELSGDGGGTPTSYCTAGTSTSGCVPAISAAQQPSVSLANPCVILVASVEGQRNGLVFYGINNTGFTPLPWGSGSTSFLCVKAPTQRTAAQNTGGTAGQCSGALALDWNGFTSANPSALGMPFSSGAKVYAQAWYRDPTAAKTTNLSNALELTYKP